MTRIPVVAGNWKMNTDAASARQLTAEIVAGLPSGSSAVEAVICPPFPYLDLVSQAASGSSVRLGAQNLHWEEKGAFTGEVSSGMVRNFAEYVILGHSERRALFGESDDLVNKKLAAAVAAGLLPIFCVGETGEERAAGRTLDVLGRQVSAGLAGVGFPSTGIVAYEPVWAIGTGQAATVADARDAISFIRAQLRKALSDSEADTVRILYGGSVTPANIADFVAEEDIDGALVGGASLNADSFLEMIRAVSGL